MPRPNRGENGQFLPGGTDRSTSFVEPPLDAQGQDPPLDDEFDQERENSMTPLPPQSRTGSPDPPRNPPLPQFPVIDPAAIGQMDAAGMQQMMMQMMVANQMLMQENARRD
jgi:hypothetical protein